MRLTGAKLEWELGRRAVGLEVTGEDWAALQAMVAPLRYKNEVTRIHYEHSCRVALDASAIAEFVHLDPKPLFYAGFTHDMGKCLVPTETLGKTATWTPTDYRRIRQHVSDSYRILRDRFDFTAGVVIWHHRFQANGYPLRLPKPLHKYSEGTRLLIVECGRMLAIADVYDALHRVNSKFGGERALTPDEIRKKMLEFNPDRLKLIRDLFSHGILT